MEISGFGASSCPDLRRFHPLQPLTFYFEGLELFLINSNNSSHFSTSTACTNLQKFKKSSKHFIQIQRPSDKVYFLIFSHVFQTSTLLLLHALLLVFRYDVVILPLKYCNTFYIIILLLFTYCFIYISNGSTKFSSHQ